MDRSKAIFIFAFSAIFPKFLHRQMASICTDSSNAETWVVSQSLLLLPFHWKNYLKSRNKFNKFSFPLSSFLAPRRGRCKPPLHVVPSAEKAGVSRTAKDGLDVMSLMSRPSQERNGGDSTDKVTSLEVVLSEFLQAAVEMHAEFIPLAGRCHALLNVFFSQMPLTVHESRVPVTWLVNVITIMYIRLL